MRWNHVCLEAMGYVLPQEVVSSAALEERIRPLLEALGLPPGQLEKLTGVKERRYWTPGTQPSAPAALAGKKALENAGLTTGDVDVLINTSVSRDYLEPATAAIVAGRMKLDRGVASYDVTNACVGFLNGLVQAANMVELGQAEVVLVVDAEVVREGVEATVQRMATLQGDPATLFRDNFATLTLGAGAVGAVVCHERVSRTGHRIRGAVARSAPEHHTLCVASASQMRSDPHGLLVHGVGLAVDTWPYAQEALGWHDPSVIDVFICHQVSVTHFKESFRQMGFPLEKAPLTLPYLGNCGPASTPLCLALSEAQGRVRPGQELCLYGVGSGLACIIMGVSW